MLYLSIKLIFYYECQIEILFEGRDGEEGLVGKLNLVSTARFLENYSNKNLDYLLNKRKCL